MPRRSLFILTVLCILFGVLGCRQETVQVYAETERPQSFGIIVAMGDSLTAGYGVELEKSYPVRLEKELQALGYSYRVVNSGVSGETTNGALARLSWVMALNPDIVILETGVNDGLRGISPFLIRKNIGTIIDRLQEKQIIIVLAGMKVVSTRGEEYTKEFQKLYSELASEKNVIFMPFFLEYVASNPILNGTDGLHPNEKGYGVIVKNLLPYVIRAIKIREASMVD